MDEQIKFIDKEHKLFFKEKIISLQEYKNDFIYYRALVYTLGICETTRNNFHKIFDIERGEINIDSINEPYQTNTSQKVTRMAFSLFNGCNYDSERDCENDKVSKNYNPSDIFCCSYTPYFFEAVKIRYPEYTKNKEEQKENKKYTYMRVGNIEQLEYYIDEKIENKEDKNIVALYMRTNRVNADEVNADIYSQRKKLEDYCKKHNISNRIYYIDVRKSGISDDREALNKLIEDIKIGKIKSVIVTDISKLYRDTIKMLNLFENDYMKNVEVKSFNGECINKKYYNECFEKVIKEIKRKQIKNKRDKSR